MARFVHHLSQQKKNYKIFSLKGFPRQLFQSIINKLGMMDIFDQLRREC